MRRNTLVTLSSDFGYRDPYVAIMKAVLLSRKRSLTLVDVTHGIPPQDVHAAALLLREALPRFPDGSTHLVVVDPGVGSTRQCLAARSKRFWYVFPDNGVLDPLFEIDPPLEMVSITTGSRPGIGNTFHGRDVFAPAAAYVAGGGKLGRLGPTGERRAPRLQFPQPYTVEPGQTEFSIIYRDGFGNLFTNLRACHLEHDEPQLELDGQRLPACRCYNDVDAQAAGWLINSYGHVEVFVRDGSAAERFPGALGGRLIQP